MIENFRTWGKSNLNKSSDIEKVRTRLDEALNNLDFNSVDNITKDLSNIINAKPSLNSVSRFNEFNNLNENVQMNQAKQYYLKKVKQELRDKRSKGRFEIESEEEAEREDKYNLDKPEIEKRLLDNPDLNWVLNLTKSTPNYAITFVKFKFDQGANNEELTTIFNFATNQSTKNFIKDLPLGNIEAYAKIPMSNGGEPGYMQLIDHIGDIESAREGFWIIDAFVTNAGIKDTMGNVISGKIGFNQKNAFKQAPQEVKDRIIKLAGDMNRRDDSGNLIKAFTRKMSTYESLDIMIEGLTDMINSIGTKKEEVSISHHNDYPGCSVLWENSEKILVLYRSPVSLGEKCRHANWCIKPRGYGAGAAGSFYSHAYNGRIQFAMWDFSKPATDDMSLVGFTVSPNGKLTHAHMKNDRDVLNVVGRTIEEVLSYYGVPDYSKAQIISSLDAESKSMIAVEPVYKEIEKGNGIENIISNLIKGAEKRANNFKYENEVDKTSAFTDRLISNEISKSSNIDKIRDTAWKTISDTTKGGLSNIESARIFNTIFGGSEYCRADKIDLILNINNDKKRRVENILKEVIGDSTDDSSKFNAYIEKNKKDSEKIISRAKTLIKSMDQANVYLESLKK